MSQTICRLCGTPIEGVEGQRTILVLGQYRLGPTVHQRCADQFTAEKEKRKPYRLRLGEKRNTPKIKEIADWEDSDKKVRLPYADDE
jgi:hypothetical protein